MANNNDDRIPAEEQYQRLVQDLRHIHSEDGEDARSLARIRERLLADNWRDQDRREPLPLLSQRERSSTMHLNSTGAGVKAPKQSSWQQRLSLIAAVLLVALLVGSLLLILHNAHQNATGNNKPAVRHVDTMLNNLHMISETTGWVEGVGEMQGEGVTVLRTTDGGIHWQDVTPQDMPHTTVWEGSPDFIDASTAWISMTLNKDASLYYRPLTTSLIFHTTDGGRTWQKTAINTGGENVRNFSFTNTRDGWLMSEQEPGIHVVTGPETIDPPSLFRTVDGGKTWVKVLDSHSPQAQLFKDVSIAGFSFKDPQTGLMTGIIGALAPGAQLYITHDGGATWQTQPWPVTRSIHQSPIWASAPSFFTARDAVISASFNNYVDFTVYSTHDGGVTWSNTPFLHTPFSPPKNVVNFVPVPPFTHFITMQTGWLLNQNENIPKTYVTNDGGQHWIAMRTEATNGTILQGLPDITTNKLGWLFTFTADPQTLKQHPDQQVTALYKTTDGGRTWTQVHAIFPSYITPASAFIH